MVEQTGYAGVALLMFAENLFPPVPSELILPLAGFTAARGDLQFVPVVIAGTAGAVAGGLFWYLIGRWIGCDRLMSLAGRHGRWLTLGPDELDRSMAHFRRHGGRAVLIGRMTPAVRTLISIPAGVSGMPLFPFLLYTTAGTGSRHRKGENICLADKAGTSCGQEFGWGAQWTIVDRAWHMVRAPEIVAG